MRRARLPFPVNLIWNQKFFYIGFIVVMIASLAAVGLGVGLGSSGGRSGAPIIEDEEVLDEEAAASGIQTFPDGPAPTIDTSQPHKAIVKTNKGDIEIDLFTDAPAAVNSFAFLAGTGFYNGTVFFFVERDFVAQAGDPTCAVNGENVCAGLGSPGYSLPVDETAEGHEKWAVVAPALAEGQQVHGSQFRILFEPDPRLDGKETVFGKVVKGQEILGSLSDFVPCSVSETEGCEPEPDLSSALVIEEIIVQPV